MCTTLYLSYTCILNTLVLETHTLQPINTCPAHTDTHTANNNFYVTDQIAVEQWYLFKFSVVFPIILHNTEQSHNCYTKILVIAFNSISTVNVFIRYRNICCS